MKLLDYFNQDPENNLEEIYNLALIDIPLKLPLETYIQLCTMIKHEVLYLVEFVYDDTVVFRIGKYNDNVSFYFSKTCALEMATEFDFWRRHADHNPVKFKAENVDEAIDFFQRQFDVFSKSLQ